MARPEAAQAAFTSCLRVLKQQRQQQQEKQEADEEEGAQNVEVSLKARGSGISSGLEHHRNRMLISLFMLDLHIRQEAQILVGYAAALVVGVVSMKKKKHKDNDTLSSSASSLSKARNAEQGK